MKPLPKRKYLAAKSNVSISLRVPDTLKKELDALAKEYGRGLSEFVTDGLDAWAALHRQDLSQAKPKPR